MNPNENFSPSSKGEGASSNSLSLDGRGEGRVLGISYDQLSKEVRSYADNLEAQVWDVFAKYGIVVGEGLAPSHTGGDKPRPYILDELKAANPTTEDLEHLSDLLEQLNYIRIHGEPSARTKREYHDSSLGFSYNETEAKRLGLKKVEVKGDPEADDLIQQVIDGSIDIKTKQGQDEFMAAWSATCPDLPPPCVPELDNFQYLIQLKYKRIISNLKGEPEPVTPNFSEDEILLIDSWEETGLDAPDAQTKLTSSLIKELLDQESVVNIKRQDLDAALWQGDPKDRLPTSGHQAILEKLDVFTAGFELRLIRQDEYAHLARTEGWGTHNLSIHFDHYFLGGDGARHGLDGGFRVDGGPSYVSNLWRGRASGTLAVRLVLAHKSPRLSRGLENERNK